MKQTAQLVDHQDQMLEQHQNATEKNLGNNRLKSLRERQHSLFNAGGGAGAVKTNPMLKNKKEKL